MDELDDVDFFKPYEAVHIRPDESGEYFVVLSGGQKAVAIYDSIENMWKDRSGIRKMWCDNIKFWLDECVFYP